MRLNDFPLVISTATVFLWIELADLASLDNAFTSHAAREAYLGLFEAGCGLLKWNTRLKFEPIPANEAIWYLKRSITEFRMILHWNQCTVLLNSLIKLKVKMLKIVLNDSALSSALLSSVAEFKALEDLILCYSGDINENLVGKMLEMMPNCRILIKEKSSKSGGSFDCNPHLNDTTLTALPVTGAIHLLSRMKPMERVTVECGANISVSRQLMDILKSRHGDTLEELTLLSYQHPLPDLGRLFPRLRVLKLSSMASITNWGIASSLEFLECGKWLKYNRSTGELCIEGQDPLPSFGWDVSMLQGLVSLLSIIPSLLSLIMKEIAYSDAVAAALQRHAATVKELRVLDCQISSAEVAGLLRLTTSLERLSFWLHDRADHGDHYRVLQYLGSLAVCEQITAVEIRSADFNSIGHEVLLTFLPACTHLKTFAWYARQPYFNSQESQTLLFRALMSHSSLEDVTLQHAYEPVLSDSWQRTGAKRLYLGTDKANCYANAFAKEIPVSKWQEVVLRPKTSWHVEGDVAFTMQLLATQRAPVVLRIFAESKDAEVVAALERSMELPAHVPVAHLRAEKVKAFSVPWLQSILLHWKQLQRVEYAEYFHYDRIAGELSIFHAEEDGAEEVQYIKQQLIPLVKAISADRSLLAVRIRGKYLLSILEWEQLMGLLKGCSNLVELQLILNDMPAQVLEFLLAHLLALRKIVLQVTSNVRNVQREAMKLSFLKHIIQSHTMLQKIVICAGESIQPRHFSDCQRDRLKIVVKHSA